MYSFTINVLFLLEVYEYTVEHASHEMTRYERFGSYVIICTHCVPIFTKAIFFTETKKNKKSRVTMRFGL